jgi:hypothetical protein
MLGEEGFKRGGDELGRLRRDVSGGRHGDNCNAKDVLPDGMQKMSCRTGPLRAGRAFARLFRASRGAPVGRGVNR